MKFKTSQYSFGVFGEFEKINAEPDNFYSLMELYKDDRLIISTFDEIISNFNLNQFSQNTISRPILHSQDKRKNISIGSNRIDFSINNETITSQISQISKVNENKTIEIFAKKLFNKYQILANRLALNYSVEILNSSNSDTKKIYDGLFKTPDYFKDNSFDTEWHQRILKKDNWNGEDVNIIFMITHVFSNIINNGKTELTKTILINFDINTSATKIDKRFTEDKISSFLEYAIEKINLISKDFEEILMYGK